MNRDNSNANLVAQKNKKKKAKFSFTFAAQHTTEISAGLHSLKQM